MISLLHISEECAECRSAMCLVRKIIRQNGDEWAKNSDVLEGMCIENCLAVFESLIGKWNSLGYVKKDSQRKLFYHPILYLAGSRYVLYDKRIYSPV